VFETVLLPISLRNPISGVLSLVRFLRNFGTQSVTLVHVASSGLESAGHARRRVEEVGGTVEAEGFETEVVLRHGSPALEICRVAQERDLSFIGIPWRKKDFLKRTLLGSVSEDIVRLADVPVFIYKQEGHPETPARMKSIVYATTFNPWHDHILPYLRSQGVAAETLYVLHVGRQAPDPEAETKRRQFVFDKLNRVKQACADCFDEVKIVSKVGNPRWQISGAAREVGAELIVLGKREEGPPWAKVTGSNAEATVHRSECSLLIVPAYDIEHKQDRE
jgi:nucleotide-binding universal stress UspA family protein